MTGAVTFKVPVALTVIGLFPVICFAGLPGSRIPCTINECEMAMLELSVTVAPEFIVAFEKVVAAPAVTLWFEPAKIRLESFDPEDLEIFV